MAAFSKGLWTANGFDKVANREDLVAKLDKGIKDLQAKANKK